ncbi:hypothetical protein ABGB07_03745 [Micromonosporaceae bacterium B7E4]
MNRSTIPKSERPAQRNRVLHFLLRPGHPVAAVVIVWMLATDPNVSAVDAVAAVIAGAAAGVALLGAATTFTGRSGR